MPPVTTDPTIRVRVLLFSVLRERVGAREVTVDLPPGATGRDVLDRLETDHPVIGAFRSAVKLAVNQRYATFGDVLGDGDEVALLTPVSGG